MNYAEAKSDKSNLDCSREVGEGFVNFLYAVKIIETLLDQNLEAFLSLSATSSWYRSWLMNKVEFRMLQQLLTKENMVCFLEAGHLYEAGNSDHWYDLDNLSNVVRFVVRFWLLVRILNSWYSCLAVSKIFDGLCLIGAETFTLEICLENRTNFEEKYSVLTR